MKEQRLKLLLVAGVQLALSLSFLAKPVHMDEAVYLRIAREALRSPAHAMGSEVFWGGRRRTAGETALNPPLALYLLAPATALEDTRLVRLAAVPFDVAAAVFLYLLASVCLKRPTLVVLSILLGPGWWLTVSALLLEKWMAAFGLAALWAASKADPAEPDRWWWSSAALAALATACKYTGVVFPLGCAAYLLARRAPPARLAAWLAVALGPAAAHAASGLLEPERLRALASRATPALDTGASHQARAVLTFTTGSVPAVALWAWLGTAPRRRLALAAAAAALLFLPLFDRAPVTIADRVLGLILGASGAAALAAAASAGAPLRGAGAGDEHRRLWLGLACSTLFLQTFVYWSVAARFTVFLSAGLAIGLAAELERALPPSRALLAVFAGALLSLLFGVGAAATDLAHAQANRDAARSFGTATASGRPARFTGHWGFQHYMQAAGATPLEPEPRGWSELRSGDRVVIPGVNTNIARPSSPTLADLRVVEAPAPLPMLLMCGAPWRCQAGFHSSAYGFLPFSFTREPVDRFEIVDVR